MTKHTPGPWKAYCRDMSHENGAEWSEENSLQWEVEGPRVPHGRGEYFQADARLIAAAPDLLESLQELVVGLPQQWVSVKKARAAIAKATGEQS